MDAKAAEILVQVTDIVAGSVCFECMSDGVAAQRISQGVDEDTGFYSWVFSTYQLTDVQEDSTADAAESHTVEIVYNLADTVILYYGQGIPDEVLNRWFVVTCLKGLEKLCDVFLAPSRGVQGDFYTTNGNKLHIVH